MQQPATFAPSSGPASFAGMLAALAAPAHKRQPVWNDDDLEDDVATLSYERALRAHGRYRAPELSDRSLTQPAPQPATQAVAKPVTQPVLQAAEAGGLRIFEVLPDDEEPMPQTPVAEPASSRGVEDESETAQDTSTSAGRNLKSASITIRLSKSECAQLRKRAAEAGLTASAYLRSCTFEAESLRALVKDTLSQLRSETPKEDEDSPAPAARSWFRQLRRFLPYAQVSQPIAQA